VKRAKSYLANMRLIHSQTNETKEAGEVVSAEFFAHVNDDALSFLIQEGFIEPADDKPKPTPE
jgi:hypothetical protein